MKTETLTIRITPPLKKLIVSLAASENRTITSLIEYLILRSAQNYTRGSR